LSKEQAEELHIKDENGELLATIPEWEAVGETPTNLPTRK